MIQDRIRLLIKRYEADIKELKRIQKTLKTKEAINRYTGEIHSRETSIKHLKNILKDYER